MKKIFFLIRLFCCLLIAYSVTPISLSGQTLQNNSVIRNTCIEVFTGTWCAPCHFAGINFKYNLLPAISNYTIIEYHQGPDFFATWEGHNRAGYYGLNYVPAFVFDGQLVSPTKEIFDSLQQLPAYLDINIADAHFTDSTVYVSGKILPLRNYNSGQYTLHVVVIEKENSLHPYSTWDTSSIYIGVRMSPNEFGTSIQSLNAGVPIFFNHSIPIELSKIQSMNNLMGVVFVEDDNNKEVLQSAWTDISFGNGLTSVSKNNSMIIRPNPVRNNLTILFSNYIPANIKSVCIHELNGRLVRMNNIEQLIDSSKIELGVSSIPAGFYIVTIDCGNAKFIGRFEKN